MMIKLIKTDSSNNDFISLVQLLDADLQIRDGEEHQFYSQFNKVDTIKYAVVAYVSDRAIGCGAIKEHDLGMEIKRMYVKPDFRGQGIAMQILYALEEWASQLGFNTCLLETGKKQPEAIRLYQKNGYSIISNYGQYVGIENSVCFKKDI